MSDKFLLNHTTTSKHHVTIDEEQIMLSQSFTFTFDAPEKQKLLWFLQVVKQDAKVRHTYAGEHYILDYDPSYEELHLFHITRRATGRVISMGWSTAGRLRLALEGTTDRLVREEEKQ